MAKNKNLSYLAHFSYLQRVQSELRLGVKTKGVKLREYFYDRDMLKNKANLVMSCLIDGAMNVYDMGWVMRSMQPSDVLVREEDGIV